MLGAAILSGGVIYLIEINRLLADYCFKVYYLYSITPNGNSRFYETRVLQFPNSDSMSIASFAKSNRM